jgi:hypothetical protein
MDEYKKTIVTFTKGIDDEKCKKKIERAGF